jgi:hypothetical protein
VLCGIGGTIPVEVTDPYSSLLPIHLAERFKARVCGPSLAGTAGSNVAGAMDVRCECCVLSGGDLREGPIPRPEDFYQL